MIERLKKYYEHRSIQFTISVSFTVVSVICMALIGLTLYSRFAQEIEDTTTKGTEQALTQTSIHLETYLRNMMRISDSMYYTVIKNKDLSVDKMDSEMDLLYEANKDNLVSIACYSNDGTLVAASPISKQKDNIDVTNQEWFVKANERMENLHFSNAHIQNLFDDSSYRHYWVVSLSRIVELTRKGKNERGVLTVDMSYSGIEQMFNRVNSNDAASYIYLMDSSGKIIYHPKQNLLFANIYSENNLVAATYDDGSHTEEFESEERIVTVRTVGYTGWKLVAVVTRSSMMQGLNATRYSVYIVLLLAINILILVNQFISVKIARPIKMLEKSIRGLEHGNLDVPIYIGGTYELKHLGTTIDSVVSQLKRLMQDIVIEQEEKSKNEMEALQSQINPHFLYNTLDSIVWMIEVDRYEEAITMISELASLFRISISKGKNIIRIEDEIKHSKNYLNIQKIRYKNKFDVIFDIQEEILSFSTVKLIIQPILENAIYYGMEYADGDGKIIVKGYKAEEDIFIEVSDNGPGMKKETAERLLTQEHRIQKKGSGVGLMNVHKRIQLYYGKEYGLTVKSKPDEGTYVTIHLPAKEYQEEAKSE